MHAHELKCANLNENLIFELCVHILINYIGLVGATARTIL